MASDLILVTFCLNKPYRYVSSSFYATGLYSLGTECGLIHRSTTCSQIVRFIAWFAEQKKENTSVSTFLWGQFRCRTGGKETIDRSTSLTKNEFSCEAKALLYTATVAVCSLHEIPTLSLFQALSSELCSVEPRGSVLTVAFTSLNAVLFQIAVPNLKLSFIERFLTRCLFLHGWVG